MIRSMADYEQGQSTSFIAAYKRLEKLCSEIYNDNHGISSYINDMMNTSAGPHYVAGWSEDLKQLKHYRWVRNRIVHDPGYTESNMCRPEDAVWIDHFRSRIMSARDPLAQYRRAAGLQRPSLSRSESNTYRQSSHTPQKPAGQLAYAVGTCLFVLAIIAVVLIFLGGK